MIEACSTCRGAVPLCDPCVDDAERQLRGVAQARGHTWAGAVRPRARPHERDAPWPAFDASPRVRGLALAKVADLARDLRLQLRLARWCVLGAASAWQAPTRPTPVAFRLRGADPCRP